MKTATKDEAYRAANMTADKCMQFQIRLSAAATEATTWSLADMERVSNQLEREIYGITWNEQQRFRNKFSIRLIDFEAWWETIGIQTLQKTIVQRVKHFRYPKMYLLSHISQSIRWMGSGDNCTTGISERLHMANLKEAYRSTNKVNYIQQILKHNDWCTGLGHMEETLSYPELQDWYKIDSAKGFNLLSATDKRRITRRAHLLCLQTIQDDPFISPASQQLYYFSETHVCVVCRSILLSSLRDYSEDFGIPNFEQLFHTQIEEDWGQAVIGLLIGYDQNVLLDSIFHKLQNRLLYYRQLFHNPASVERLGFDCKVEYTNANEGIMPESHNIWVQYMQSEENDLDNTFQERVPSFPVLYFSWTPPNQILQFQERLPAGTPFSTLSKRCQITQQWVLCPQAQEYAVVIPTK